MNYTLQVQQIINNIQDIEGLTFLQFARMLNLDLPMDLTHAKGWIGQAIEKYLGATAGCLPIPDFPDLNLELKTLPLHQNAKVSESTYVTTLPLLGDFSLIWEQSSCFQKLQQVLWILIEGDKAIPYHQRRIIKGILWQPDALQNEILKRDWETITEMVIQGQVEEIHGGIGEYLHIRPKAADSSMTTQSMNQQGQVIQTLPRGFYLRTQLTNQFIQMQNK
jgi:DNA mismatch repair protein MutH